MTTYSYKTTPPDADMAIQMQSVVLAKKGTGDHNLSGDELFALFGVHEVRLSEIGTDVEVSQDHCKGGCIRTSFAGLRLILEKLPTPRVSFHPRAAEQLNGEFAKWFVLTVRREDTSAS